MVILTDPHKEWLFRNALTQRSRLRICEESDLRTSLSNHRALTVMHSGNQYAVPMLSMNPFKSTPEVFVPSEAE